MVPVLELSNVWKVYALDTVNVSAVKGVSLTVFSGEFVAIMGASGSGKSSLLNIVGALDLPTKGLVRLDGTDITQLAESDLARIRGKKIGFVFQSFNLHPTLNVFENIALPMRIHEFEENRIRSEVQRLLSLVRLEHRRQHFPSQLSGGERQRVAIARALSTNPSMILADEPTGNLDSETSHEILGLFRELHVAGKTIVLVTHAPDIAAFAGRIIELRDGQVLSDYSNDARAA